MGLPMTDSPAPLSPAQPHARRFQFSMLDMLIVLFIIGTVMTIRHMPGNASEAWIADAVTVALGVIGAGLGAVFAWKCEFGVVLRRVTIVGSVVLALISAGLVAGKSTYTCWRCGAVMEDSYGLYSSVTASYLSERIEKACGQRCTHPHWQLRGSNSLLAMSSVEPARAPILMLPFAEDSVIIREIESIPNPSRRCEVIDALGDEHNRLKYAAMLAVLNVRDTAPSTEDEWAAWWSENAEVFRRQTSATDALPAAQATIQRIRQGIRQRLPENVLRNLKEDLPGIVLP
jgi:hypothetical protein